MHSSLTVLCLMATMVAAVHGFAGSPPTRPYPQSLTLDHENKYTVYWDFNDTHITFEVHVQTNGYVGFGISLKGNMYPADVVVGWVKDGHVHFADRHTIGKQAPVIDAHQDWFLLHGEETGMWTILQFVRKLDTCDVGDDIAINDQTMRLIYSYHPDDPVSDTHLQYHGGGRRGAKSVSLLRTSLPPPSFASDDIKIYDFLGRNYIIPPKETTYLCTAFQMPDMPKHHLVEFAPVFTPGNELLVHHLVVQRCPGKHPDLHLKQEECFWNWPKDWPHCPEVVVFWGAGAGPFYFPENTGYSIGADDDYSFYVMQTHYTNVAHTPGIIDNSGLRVKLTTNLRQYDVGTLTLGLATDKVNVIPPQESAFVTPGYCSPNCFEKPLTDLGTTEVKIIAGMQHAHLLSKSIITRHFRNGVEIEPLLNDPYYDYFLQDVRPITPPRPIQQNDSFTVECTYNTMHLSTPAFGGLSTLEEMCLSVFYVYPKMPIHNCMSKPAWNTYPEKVPLSPWPKEPKGETDVVNQENTELESLRKLVEEKREGKPEIAGKIHAENQVEICGDRATEHSTTLPHDISGDTNVCAPISTLEYVQHKHAKQSVESETDTNMSEPPQKLDSSNAHDATHVQYSLERKQKTPLNEIGDEINCNNSGKPSMMNLNSNAMDDNPRTSEIVKPGSSNQDKGHIAEENQEIHRAFSVIPTTGDSVMSSDSTLSKDITIETNTCTTSANKTAVELTHSTHVMESAQKTHAKEIFDVEKQSEISNMTRSAATTHESAEDADILTRTNKTVDMSTSSSDNEDTEISKYKRKRTSITRQAAPFNFEIDKDTWTTIKPVSKNYHGRGRSVRGLQNSWTNVFAEKTNAVYSGCVLAFKSHRVKAGGSRKLSGPFLVASAVCKGENCNSKFVFNVDQEPTDDVGVNVNCVVNCTIRRFE